MDVISCFDGGLVRDGGGHITGRVRRSHGGGRGRVSHRLSSGGSFVTIRGIRQRRSSWLVYGGGHFMLIYRRCRGVRGYSYRRGTFRWFLMGWEALG